MQKDQNQDGRGVHSSAGQGTPRNEAGCEDWIQREIPAPLYDLKTTLTSGQAFRWNETPAGWEGVVAGQWMRLTQGEGTILALTQPGRRSLALLRCYLQSDMDWEAILRTFPPDQPLKRALQECLGLRVLRQEPWECLASFILSSTKQIIQIRQIVAKLCKRFGDPVIVPAGVDPAYSFPSAARLARVSEADLRACGMGFRAKYLSSTARLIDSGSFDLDRVAVSPLIQAREMLRSLPGVGPKIADCVLLFGYDFPQAFPIDVWVRRALQDLYFRAEPVSLPELARFSEAHFGPYGGYAQQYLFHWLRTQAPGKSSSSRQAGRTRTL